MEVWNGIWKKILVWNGIWNGRFLVWNWNGMEENCKYGIWKNRLPFHSIPCPAENTNCKSLTVTADRKVDLFSYSYLVD